MLIEEYQHERARISFAGANYTNISDKYVINPSSGLVEGPFGSNVKPLTRIGGKRYTQSEASSTNNSTYTSDVSQWIGNALVSKIRGYLDPTGALGATRIIGNASIDAHSIRTNTCNVSEFSAYVKSAGYDYVMVLLYYGAASRMIFSILNGTGYVISDSGSKIVSYGSNLSANGFRRIWIKTIGGSSTNNQIGIARDSSTFEWSADGINGVDVWNPQYEESNYPTSPILTSSVPVTRNKDQIYLPAALVPGELKDGVKFTLYPEWSSSQYPSNVRRFVCSFADPAGDIKVYGHSNGGFYVLKGESTLITTGAGATSFSAYQKLEVTLNRLAGTLKLGGFTTGNGTYIGTTWSRTVGNLYIGQDSTESKQWDGLIGEPEIA